MYQPPAWWDPRSTNTEPSISAPEPCRCTRRFWKLPLLVRFLRIQAWVFNELPLTAPPSRTPTRNTLEILYTSQLQQPHQSLNFLPRPAHASLLQVGEKTKADATTMHLPCRRRRLRRDGSILPHHYAWLLHAAGAPRLFREREKSVRSDLQEEKERIPPCT